jgi:hypothetical protein
MDTFLTYFLCNLHKSFQHFFDVPILVWRRLRRRTSLEEGSGGLRPHKPRFSRLSPTMSNV